jgi:hypothetical protein
MNRITLAACAALVALPAAAQIVVPQTDTAFIRPEVAVDGYLPFDGIDGALAEVDDLADADLYSSITGDEIGEVEDMVADASGQIRFVELDVGGFLGLGEKHVLVPFDQVRILARGDDDYRVYIEATEEQLEEYPRYDD